MLAFVRISSRLAGLKPGYPASSKEFLFSSRIFGRHDASLTHYRISSMMLKMINKMVRGHK